MVRVFTKWNSPGRFFAVHVFNMILGHLLTTYDFEPLGERPIVKSMGGIDIHDGTTLIGIRLGTSHTKSKD